MTRENATVSSIGTGLIALLAVVLPAARALAQGCAMCGSSFEPNDPVTKAMNVSIVFLLLTPYVLLAGVAGWLYVRFRQRGAHQRAAVIALPWVRAGLRPRGPEED